MRATDVVLAILPLIGHSLCASSASPSSDSSRFANTTSSVHSEGATQNPTKTASTTESIITVPANLSLTGTAYASSCNLAKVSWSVANASWYSAHSPTSDCTSIFTPTTYTGSSSDVDLPYTTLCDGHARLPEDWVWPTYTNVSSVLDTTSCPPLKPIPTFKEPRPSCSVPASYCTQLWSDFATSGGWMYAGTQNPVPQCSTSSDFYPGCEKCYISAYELQLYYWPVTTTGANSCYQDGTTVTAKPTGNGPNTRVVDGFTMTSPSVYLAFQNIAASAANMSCGPDITSTTIAMNPTDVYSLSMTPLSCFNTAAPSCSLDPSATTRVNFADFNWPVPFSAYQAMGQCSGTGDQDSCHNMTLPLMPELALPTWLPDVFPAWKNCKPMPTGVYDPPRALQAVTAIQGPEMTLSAPVSSTSASAGPSRSADLPFATSTATSTALGDQQSPSSSSVIPQSNSASAQIADPPALSQHSDDPGTSSMADTTTVNPSDSTVATPVSSSDPPTEAAPPLSSTQSASSSASTGGIGGWIFSGLGGKLSTTETVIVSATRGAGVSTTSTIIVAETHDPTLVSTGDITGGEGTTVAATGDQTEAAGSTSTVHDIAGIIASLAGQMRTTTLDPTPQAPPPVITIAVASTQNVASIFTMIMQSAPSSYTPQGTTAVTATIDPSTASPNSAHYQTQSVFEIVRSGSTYTVILTPSGAAQASNGPVSDAPIASASGSNSVLDMPPAQSSKAATGTPLPSNSTETTGTNGMVATVTQTYTLNSGQFSALLGAMGLDPATMSSLLDETATISASSHSAGSVTVVTATSSTSSSAAPTETFQASESNTIAVPSASNLTAALPSAIMSSFSSSVSTTSQASVSSSTGDHIRSKIGLRIASIAFVFSYFIS